MSDEKKFVFTDADLDGAGSYSVYRWCTGENTPYTNNES